MTATTITVDMLDAIKVQFLKPIFEDDFVERGMKAWLTKIEWNERVESYELYFDFKDFEAENEKYFTEVYFSNIHTPKIPGRELFTALEAGMYTAKLKCYLSVNDTNTRDYAAFAVKIKQYLKVI